MWPWAVYGPADPGTTDSRSSDWIDGHQYFSMCSITSSVPRAWLTWGGWRGPREGITDRQVQEVRSSKPVPAMVLSGPC